jgi:hypothetical protein
VSQNIFGVVERALLLNMMSPKWAVKNKIDLDFCARAFFTSSTTEKGKIEKKGSCGK